LSYKWRLLHETVMSSVRYISVRSLNEVHCVILSTLLILVFDCQIHIFPCNIFSTSQSWLLNQKVTLLFDLRIHCFYTSSWPAGRQQACKNWVLLLCWQWFDWSLVHLWVLVGVTATSIISCSINLVQDDLLFRHQLAQVVLEHWPLNADVRVKHWFLKICIHYLVAGL